MDSVAQGMCLGVWDDKDDREGLPRRWRFCQNHKRNQLLCELPKECSRQSKSPEAGNICSKHSETGSKTVHLSEALDALEEAQQDSVQARLCCGC